MLVSLNLILRFTIEWVAVVLRNSIYKADLGSEDIATNSKKIMKAEKFHLESANLEANSINRIVMVENGTGGSDWKWHQYRNSGEKQDDSDID